MFLHLTVGEIADLVQAKSLHNIDRSFMIEAISSMSQASKTDLAILFDKEEGSVFEDSANSLVAETNAGVILTSRQELQNQPCIVVEDSIAAFEKLINSRNETKRLVADDECIVHSRAFAHETAHISEKAIVDAYATIEAHTTIGRATHIGTGSYIGRHCSIGNNVIIYPNVTILDRTHIGNNTIVHSGVVIGSDGFRYHISRKGMRKIPHVGIVRIGNNVEIGANTCIDRAVFTETVISDNVKLDNQIHIAHNVTIGPHTAIIAQTGIAGNSSIGAQCFIGGQVGIKNNIAIGNNVKIVSQSGIMKNLNDGAIVSGTPAMPLNEWKRSVLIFMKLPKLISQYQKPFRTSPWFIKNWIQRCWNYFAHNEAQ